ncbi:rhomboid-like protein [Embleya sp. NPDC008237]|uniref:rhomboid-like protein n=1 Tax=Embleya sp. NPDC008237 TaxID=3363978 RepID=UPI0036F0FD43
MPRQDSTRRALGAVRDWMVSAPGTYLWLLILYVTTADQYIRLTADERIAFLRGQSTNLHNLDTAPLRVLVTSAAWDQGLHLFKFTVMFTVLCAVAERWIGTRRWLAVAALGHVGATCISQAIVLAQVHAGTAAPSARFQLDVGPSYGYMAVAGLLCHRIAGPWLWPYLAGLALYVGLPMFVHRDFTATGHLSAVLIGLCCLPFTRSRPKWDSGAWWRTVRPRSVPPESARQPAGPAGSPFPAADPVEAAPASKPSGGFPHGR